MIAFHFRHILLFSLTLIIVLLFPVLSFLYYYHQISPKLSSSYGNLFSISSDTLDILSEVTPGEFWAIPILIVGPQAGYILVVCDFPLPSSWGLPWHLSLFLDIMSFSFLICSVGETCPPIAFWERVNGGKYFENCISENIFILLFQLINIGAGHKILGWKYFFLRNGRHFFLALIFIVLLLKIQCYSNSWYFVPVFRLFFLS